jgi:hypothetical protein
LARHGLFYVLYGADVYVLDLVHASGADLVKSALLRVGPSTGAGVQIPLAGGRAFAEVLAHYPIYGPSHPDVIFPIVFGFRH